MPVGLPATASPFVVIGEGDAFNEWVIFLMGFSKVIAVNLEEVLSLVKDDWVVLLEDVVGHSCDQEMGLTVPGVDSTDGAENTD